MITYEYRCDANDTTLTVRHSINEKLESWGELCSLTIQPRHSLDTTKWVGALYLLIIWQ